MPNAETVEAMREVQQMKADPSLGKTYNNVDQMMEELLFFLLWRERCFPGRRDMNAAPNAFP